MHGKANEVIADNDGEGLKVAVPYACANESALCATDPSCFRRVAKRPAGPDVFRDDRLTGEDRRSSVLPIQTGLGWWMT